MTVTCWHFIHVYWRPVINMVLCYTLDTERCKKPQTGELPIGPVVRALSFRWGTGSILSKFKILPCHTARKNKQAIIKYENKAKFWALLSTSHHLVVHRLVNSWLCINQQRLLLVQCRYQNRGEKSQRSSVIIIHQLGWTGLHKTSYPHSTSA